MTAQRRADNVSPLSFPPRGLNRLQAAAHVGVLPPKLDEMAADGRMPQPECIDVRRMWDRLAIDEAFSALPDQEERNPWYVPEDRDWSI